MSKKKLPSKEPLVVSSRSVTAKPEWQILQEWVADLMTYYIKVGDPILKLGHATVKQMVKERLEKSLLVAETKKRHLLNSGVVKKPAFASPRASVPVKDAKPKPRQIIGKIDIKDIL